MRVLVAVATRHGSTQGIADSIGEVIREHGLDCTVATVEGVASVSEYDAVVLGSGIYVGHWLKSAREFAEAHSEELAARPTWLFSSGPIESAGSARSSLESAPVEDVRRLAERIGARGQRTFAGRSTTISSASRERVVARIVRSPEGDFRDWDAIRAWAGHDRAGSDRIRRPTPCSGPYASCDLVAGGDGARVPARPGRPSRGRCTTTRPGRATRCPATARARALRPCEPTMTMSASSASAVSAIIAAGAPYAVRAEASTPRSCACRAASAAISSTTGCRSM